MPAWEFARIVGVSAPPRERCCARKRNSVEALCRSFVATSEACINSSIGLARTPNALPIELELDLQPDGLEADAKAVNRVAADG